MGRVDESDAACAFLFSFSFFKWRLARAHYFHSLDQDQSTVAKRAETTVARVFPDELRVRSFAAWTAA